MSIERVRSYNFYFDGPTGSFLKVVDTIGQHARPNLRQVIREYSYPAISHQIRKLIKVLALTHRDTHIQLGIDGWSVSVWSEKPDPCLSVSPKLNSVSSSTTKETPLEI